MRKERLSGEQGGWALYQSLEPTLTAWLRFAERGERLVLVELRVDQGIDTDTLRALPLGRIDAWANSEDGHLLREWIDRGEPDFATGTWLNPDLAGDEPAIPEMKLEVPSTRDYGDDFYRQVARFYASAAQRVRAPTMALAEANDVPVTTARRWVKEARARGFLPAGRAGKAG